MAPPFVPWADIAPELLAVIGDGLRQTACWNSTAAPAAWRAALPQPIPSLVAVTVPPPGASPFHRHIPDVFALFLPAERAFPLTTLRRGSVCVGASSGWLAVDARSCSLGIYLVSRLAGCKEIRLLPLNNGGGRPVRKIVFAPDPKPDDYVAVAICDARRLAYTKTRDMKWMVLDVAIGKRDEFVDLAYDDTGGGGKVYSVTLLGDVRVLHIPQRQRRRPIVAPLLAGGAGGGLSYAFDPAAAAYAPPYDGVSRVTGAKNVFFLGGDLYQVWRNVTRDDDVFVLRYDPERRPCWDAVADLGGYSVFVGKNHPMVLRPEDAPGVRANCVYWINERSRNELMVFDMATRTSTLHPSAAKALALSPSCKPVCCWYFLDDKITERSKTI